MSLQAILILALGTYALRVAGPLLSDRVAITARAEWLMRLCATVLLLALVAISTFTEGAGFSGWARPAGVALGGVLAANRAPFLLVIVAAAATTAVLRLLGVSLTARTAASEPSQLPGLA